MFNVKNSKLGAVLAAGMSVLGYGNQAQAGEDMLVLIDQSGSMFDTSVAGAPRYIVARQLAADTVNAAAADREYALWTFQNNSYSEVVPFSAHATQAQIVAEIWGLPDPGGSTPLAGSICDAVDELVAYVPTVPDDKRLELFSDGLENSTPSTNECYGPNSADHSNPDVGSWEWKVFNKVQTGNANSAANPPIPLIVNADYLFEHESGVFAAFGAGPFAPAPAIKAQAPVRLGKLEIARAEQPVIEIAKLPELERIRVIEGLQKQTPSSLIRSQILEGVKATDLIVRSPAIESRNTVGFYQALTEIAGEGAGGRYREFSTSSPRLPQLGDVTGDNCVNQDDLDAIKANWGAAVAAGNLLDQNQDHAVDRFDQMTVLQNFGEGCKQ
jgi:hypothetical protein